MSLRSKVTLAQKIVTEAQKELNKEKVEKYKVTAKKLLEEIQESKRTVELLERQLKNFMKEVDLNN